MLVRELIQKQTQCTMFICCYKYPALNYNIETANETLENVLSDILALQYENKITFTKELRIV